MLAFDTMIKRRFPDISSELTVEFAKFASKMSILTEAEKGFLYNLGTKEFWQIFGKNEYTKLYPVVSLFSPLICSSASSERVWSIYKFIHTRLRNRLSTEKVDKLVFLYVNCAIYNEDKADYIFDDVNIITDDDFDTFE